MEAQQVAKRYARGLFEASRAKHTTDAVSSDFKDIARICEEDRSLLNFLSAPQIGDDDKSKLMQRVFEGQISDYLYHLLQLLVGKHRSDYLLGIAEEFDNLVLDSRGIIKTRIISAVPLGAEEAAAVKNSLEKKTGNSLQVETEVDPSIIGGLIAIVGDKIIDRSVRHQLQLLREHLMELKVN